MTTLCLVLGDQLSHTLSSIKAINKVQDQIIMAELQDETQYVKHHKKKIALIFAAMRHFKQELTDKGYYVTYYTLDKKFNSFSDVVKHHIEQHKIDRIIITCPGEYRLLEQIETWHEKFNLEVDILSDNRFMSTTKEFNTWANGRKQLRMEFFYRHMRQKHAILMKNDKPIGGKWNYDAENRKPAKSNLNIPKPTVFEVDEITQQVLELVHQNFNDHWGDLEPFEFAVTRQQALKVLDQFIKVRLANFGDYQDAMLTDEPWLFHSHISFYLNCGLLTAKECITKAEKAYHDEKAPINAVEGFIRQILGWREFVRGLYWYKMPEYEKSNFFNAKRKLPDFYWNANTKLHCVQQCVRQTQHYAYAHHIQRLMVLGNFALLTGIAPEAINEWFMIVYADAYQWVVLPNVTGMAIFADGGYLASKPYAAGGAYINKMSNYCKNCQYDVKQKTGDNACPFNYLYWNFLVSNQSKLKNNQRLAMIYNTWNKMTTEKQNAILKAAKVFLKSIN